MGQIQQAAGGLAQTALGAAVAGKHLKQQQEQINESKGQKEIANINASEEYELKQNSKPLEDIEREHEILNTSQAKMSSEYDLNISEADKKVEETTKKYKEAKEGLDSFYSPEYDRWVAGPGDPGYDEAAKKLNKAEKAMNKAKAIQNNINKKYEKDVEYYDKEMAKVAALRNEKAIEVKMNEKRIKEYYGKMRTEAQIRLGIISPREEGGKK